MVGYVFFISVGRLECESWVVWGGGGFGKAIFSFFGGKYGFDSYGEV